LSTNVRGARGRADTSRPGKTRRAESHRPLRPVGPGIRPVAAIPRPRTPANQRRVPPPAAHVLSPYLTRRRSLLVKHLLDRVLALLAITALAPLLVVVAACVQCSSSGCVIYRQVRIGREGEPFVILKFRTMVADADADLPALLKAQGRDGRPLFKVDRDPRVTRLGVVLRRTSIDELPQLWNVVRGEMSLVGPRPQRPAEVALYTPQQRQRLLVRPGITGLWQVSGRSICSWEQAVGYDLEYIRRWTPALDLVILARTVPAVLRSVGAC